MNLKPLEDRLARRLLINAQTLEGLGGLQAGYNWQMVPR